MPRPALHLLGGPTLFDPAGVPISGGPVQRHRIALLAQLVIASPNAVSRDRLIGLLWPDRDTAAGRRLLNVAVTVLRQALGTESIASVGDDLRLESGAIDADVHQFERLLDDGRLEDAVAMCRGAFLEGFFLDDAGEFERWVEAQRMRLARRYVNALTVLAERATRAGDHVAAAGWWRALGHAEPTNPAVVVQLMDALAAVGDVAGAFAAEETHAAYMRAEVGIEPDARVISRGEALRASLVQASAGIALPRVTAVRTPPETPPHVPGIARQRRRATVPTIAAVVLVLLGTVGWRVIHGRQSVSDHALVAVILPVTRSADISATDAEAFSSLLTLDLMQIDGVRILRPDAGPELRSSASVIVSAHLATDSAGFVATVRLVDTAGTPIGDAAARVDRGNDPIPALVDAASVRILRSLWGRRWFVPEPRVAAISTNSIPAMRAFLQGEHEFRAAHWDSAAARYRAAADVDSTFALAYFRMAEVNGWRDAANSKVIDDDIAHAERFATRLPPREASLLRYRRLFAMHRVEAVDSAVDLARRYPGDPDAEFALADAWTHAGIVTTISVAEFARQWHRAIAADRVSVLSLQHTVDVARDLGMRAWYDSILMLRQLRGGDTISNVQRMQAFVNWAPMSEIRDTILSHARTDQRVRKPVSRPLYEYALRSLAHRCSLGLEECHGADTLAQRDVVRILDNTSRAIPSDHFALAELTLDRGMIERAHALIDSGEPARQLTLLASLDPRLGAPAAALARRMSSGASQSWGRQRTVAELALAARDTAFARKELQVLATTLRGDIKTWGPWRGSFSPWLARAAAGWLLVVVGDTARGIAQMDSSIKAAGFISEAHQEGQTLSDQLAVIMAAYGPTRNAGIARLQWITTLTDVDRVVLRWHLARALDAAGRGPEAANEYERFARLWRGADPPWLHYAADAAARAVALRAHR